MFVRRRINPSGSISIFVVDKSQGRYDIVKSYRAVKDKAAADIIENKAREWIRSREGAQGTLFDNLSEDQLREEASSLEQGCLELAGPELIYGAFFDRLGLGAGRDPLFRHMVVCRLYNPGSKSRTAAYLRRYLGSACEVKELYRVVDGLRLTDLHVSEAAPAECLLIPSPLSRVPFLLLVDAEGCPVAGRLADRRLSGAALERSIQRFARKYGASSKVVIGKGGRFLSAFFRIGEKDLSFRPMPRRKRGRVEGHLCVCLAAYAVQVELEKMLSSSGSGLTLQQVRDAARTIFRVNYVSPYTRRPKSVLSGMNPLQKQVYDLVQANVNKR